MFILPIFAVATVFTLPMLATATAFTLCVYPLAGSFKKVSVEGLASSFVIGNTPNGLVVPVIVSPTWNVPETIEISSNFGTAY
mgnify:CR=1 FL=1